MWYNVYRKREKPSAEREITTMMEYFVVAIEGVANWFTNFEVALEEYETLKALGYHEATLRKESPDYDEPLYYNSEAHAFFTA